MSGTWFDRAGYWRAQQRRKKSDPEIRPSDFKEVYSLELSPLPCLVAIALADRQLFVQGLIEEVVREAAALREGRVLGVAAICRANPHSVPNVQRSPAPLVHAGCRETRLAFRRAFGEFVVAYRDAAVRQKVGLVAVFPEGSFPPAKPFVELAAA